MAQIYGGRWENVSSFDSGGQSDLFVVQDTSSEYNDQLILKRIRNPKRRDRFIAEVNSCKKLNHENIIKLIDHSAFDNSIEDKMYIVMPFLKGGNLAKRVQSFKDSIDSTLNVAKQISLGLQCAHSNEVIHRDIKPENIIFFDDSNKCVIADFGIALIRDNVRSTEDGEIVGPRSFLAPELEEGGVLDVETSADIYSLGKVIYYLITGGIILPRERLRDSKYNIFNSSGMRMQLLGLLLDRMICEKTLRVKTIDEIINKIDEIINWDKKTGIQINPNIFKNIESFLQIQN